MVLAANLFSLNVDELSGLIFFCKLGNFLVQEIYLFILQQPLFPINANKNASYQAGIFSSTPVDSGMCSYLCPFRVKSSFLCVANSS